MASASDKSYYPGNVPSQFKTANVQAPAIADAEVNHAIGSPGVVENAAAQTDTKAAVDALGVKINSIIDALERAGISVPV